VDTVKSLLLASRLDKVDAKVLLQFICRRHLGWTKEQLISNHQVQLPLELINDWLNIEELRKQGHPVAYLTQTKSFYNIELLVNEHVLIPRPETELLVEQAISFIEQAFAMHSYNPEHLFRLMDMGTGSGAIILSIAEHFKSTNVYHLIDFVATDLSENALDVAKLNASTLGITPIKFFKSNWFNDLSDLGQFDLIISNPPYIANDDHHLREGDLRFEPQLALTDHQDGLSAYRILANQGRLFLKDGGAMMVEHGYLQKEPIHDIFDQNGFHHLSTLKDLSAHPRVTTARLSL